MWNMKALTLTNQKIWLIRKFLQANKRTHGSAKNYMPPIYGWGEGHKKQFIYNLEWKCGQCRSEIRLHVLCSLILIYSVHKSFLCHQQQRKSKISSVMTHLRFSKFYNIKADIVQKCQGVGCQARLWTSPHLILKHIHKNYLIFSQNISVLKTPVKENILSHNDPCFQSNIAVRNLPVSHMCEVKFHDVIGKSTVHLYSYAKHSKAWLNYMAKQVCFGPLFFNLIVWIQLCDKKNLTFVDCCDKILLNLSWKCY